MKSLMQLTALVILALILFTGCGNQDSDNANTEAAETENASGLSDFEMKNGIGPIDEEVTISEVDQSLADKGREIFKTKCSACHKMDNRYVGPELGNVLEVRTPTYVMNMMLNPGQMVKEHPVAKQLLAEFMTPMPDQNLTPEEARAIVEYLASEKE